ncbi:response regulator [Telmatospirillum sp.]|uniref:response regulator n=1 Tax=Telmatospirillum sp. TaxID=2079197 RepID=UPI002846DD46|nr:response regulator [Telmatospirillum sp.]MDR3440303.1 response regulator [Telmatospirillum sp.]
MLDILLVEDSPGDARLAAEAWKETGLPGHLHVVADGVQAIHYLRQSGTPLPDLLLLDLNLPLKDGWEVLAEIKDDPALKRIPVVVLTTSQAENDILQSYDLHANCFIAKPVDLDGFISVIRSIADFWGRVVLLPPR